MKTFKQHLYETKNKPYVRPYYSSSGEHVGWKAMNKHGKTKYFGKEFKTSAEKHAGENYRSLTEKCWKGYKQVGGKMKSGRMVPNCVPIKEDAVSELKKKLEAHEETLKDCDKDELYEKIDKMMKEIASDHDITPKKLHDMWVEKYGKIPDTWIMSEDLIYEKNKPTSPEKWARAKAAAKAKFSVYPSAYANAWAAKKYKAMGGGWKSVNEDLRQWFKQKWVRFDTKGNIKGQCAREPGEGKPKCLPQAKAHALGKTKRAAAARKKRREDPNPERAGKAIFVKTKVKK